MHVCDYYTNQTLSPSDLLMAHFDGYVQSQWLFLFYACYNTTLLIKMGGRGKEKE